MIYVVYEYNKNCGKLIKVISHLCDDRQRGNKNELHVF